MKTKGTGTATGKIILMGEHAVVYGQPAIAFPFNGTQVTATVHAATENQLQTTSYQGSIEQSPTELQAMKQLATYLQTQLATPNFALQIAGTIPPERGMGSSAALAVAITRAFFDWQEQTLDEATLLMYADYAEKITHGNPSGIDAATTSSTQPLYFKRNEPWQPFTLHLDAYLLVADTGIKGQTKQAVQDVATLMTQAPVETRTKIQRLGALTDLAQQAIVAHESTELGRIMCEAHTLLKQLSVSNDTLDQYIYCAMNLGALGAKLTGGGRGGCFIVLTKTQAIAETIAQELKNQGVNQTWIQGLGVYEHV